MLKIVSNLGVVDDKDRLIFFIPQPNGGALVTSSVPAVTYRITESGNYRITEAGDNRITE